MPTVNGTEGNDILTGTDDADTINGLGGDDLIQGGFGADQLFGGEGDDTFVFTRVGSGSAQPLGRIDGGAGTDTLDLSQISGASVSGDRLQIGNQFHQLVSIERVLLGAGDDAFSYTSATTNLTLYGGAGNDTLAGGSGRDVLYGGDGNDRITAGAGDTAYGEDGADVISGGDGVMLDGGAGDDALSSGLNAIMYGGAGNDVMTSGSGSVLYGGAGRNQLTGGSGSTLYGGDEGDQFFNRSGGSLVGGMGNDTFTVAQLLYDRPGAGAGSISGGLGIDTLISGAQLTGTLLWQTDSTAYIDLTAGTYARGDNRFSVTGIENVTVDLSMTSNAVVRGSDGANVLSAIYTPYLSPGGSRFGNMSPGSWTVDGGGGDDIINGRYATRILGGAGNDVIYGGAGAYFDGGEGVDTVSIIDAAAGVTISLRDGTFAEVRNGVLEFRREFLSIENLTATSYDDVITGSDADNVINGGAGLDAMVFTSRRADVTISYENGQVIVTGAEGRDTLTNIEQLRFADSIYDIDSNGRFSEARLTLVGTAGADTLNGAGSNDIISGRAGDDFITGGFGNDSLYGEEGADILYGGDGADGLDGGDGDDVLYGEAGADRLEGRAGNDRLDGGDGSDLLSGGDGNDTLLGGSGDDNLTGEAGDDVLGGGDGVDVISGGDGNDVIIASQGFDTINGGTGVDRYVGGDTGLIIDLRQGFVRIDRSTTVATLADVENLTGGAGADFFVGDAGANRLEGGGGDDYLSGFTGDDVLLGGDGDDQLEGGAGADQQDGGAGLDTAVFNYTYASAAIRFENGVIIVSGAEGEDRLTNIERLRFTDRTISIGNLVAGTSGPDVLIGTTGDDYLSGGDGDDVLDGRGGLDTIDGGAGRDRYLMGGFGGSIDLRSASSQTTSTGGVTLIGIEDVTGTAGNDFIVGSAGANRLVGGSGDDLVSGFTGDDVLTGGSGNDVIDGGAGTDTAVFSGTRATSTVSVSNGVFTVVGPDGTDRVSNVEVMQFSDGTYDVVGGRLAAQARQTLSGTAGGDILTGGESNDVLNGLDGADLLIGGMSSDTLNGGAGFDAALYAGVVRQYVAQGGGTTTISGGPESGVDTLIGIEEARFVDGALTFDVESASARVMRLYDAALDRLPDQGGLETYAVQLARGAMTLQSLANAFVASTEFQARYGNLSNQGFVEQLYRFALDRNGDPAGVQAWVNNLDNGLSRGEVLVAFSESAEHRILTSATLARGLWIPDADAITIARLYDATFDRLPDVEGLASWVENLKTGMPLSDIAAAFASSAEFQTRYGSLTNQAFVEQLYRFTLDRNGDPGGVQSWVNNLNNGMSRAEVLKFFSESAEHISLTAPLWLGGIRYQGYQGAAVEAPDTGKGLHEALTLPGAHDTTVTVNVDDGLYRNEDADWMLTLSNDAFVIDRQSDPSVIGAQADDTPIDELLSPLALLEDTDAVAGSVSRAHSRDHALTLAPDGLFSDTPFDQLASWTAVRAEADWLH